VQRRGDLQGATLVGGGHVAAPTMNFDAPCASVSRRGPSWVDRTGEVSMLAGGDPERTGSLRGSVSNSRTQPD